MKMSVSSLLFIILALCPELSTKMSLSQDAKVAPAQWNGDLAEGWDLYSKLSYEDAGSLLEKIYEKARAEGNSIEWTRCLVYKTSRISSPMRAAPLPSNSTSPIPPRPGMY